MIQVVVDVNVLVSALVGPMGFSRRVVTAWQEERLGVITADGILSELDEKLRLPRISKRLPDPDTNRQWIFQLLRTQAQLIRIPPHECVVVTGDPEDDYVLAATRLGRANYLVTGDQDLLGLKVFGGAKIVSPRELVTILESRPS
jgi:uncharacterized protein